MNRNLIGHFFLTSKPYSYAGEISRGVLYSLILLPKDKTLAINVSASISFLMWLYFNWQSDYIQQNSGRIRPPKLLFLIPLLITLLVAFYYGGLIGLIGIFLYALSIILYSFKAKNSILGLFGPFLRLLNGLTLYIAIAFSLGLSITSDSLIVALIVSFYLAIRNLIGDVRDIKNDRWEIPARLGIAVTIKIIRLEFIVLLFSFLLFSDRGIFPLYGFAIIVISWLISEIAMNKFGFDNAHIWGYAVHRILVILLPVFYLTYLLMLSLPFVWFIFLIGLISSLQWTYSLLPGKDFPKITDLKKFLV